MFRVSDIIDTSAEILRDGSFSTTQFPDRDILPALLYASNAEYLTRCLAAPEVAAILTTPDLAGGVPPNLGVVVAADPEATFLGIHNRLALDHGMSVEVEAGIHPSAQIHPTAVIEPGVSIGPGVTVGPQAVLHRGTVLAEGVVVGSGALIGTAGSFRRLRPGRAIRAEHVGGVRIGAHTHVMSGVVIERALFVEFTSIGSDCTLSTDALVCHGSTIGDRSELGPGAKVAGFSRVGSDVWIGPGAVVSNLLTIGDGARVEIGAVVVRSVPAGARYSGLFARPHARMRAISRAIAALAH